MTCHRLHSKSVKEPAFLSLSQSPNTAVLKRLGLRARLQTLEARHHPVNDVSTKPNIWLMIYFLPMLSNMHINIIIVAASVPTPLHSLKFGPASPQHYDKGAAGANLSGDVTPCTGSNTWSRMLSPTSPMGPEPQEPLL